MVLYPLGKLVLLLGKTGSKYIAKKINNKITGYPAFGKMCQTISQKYINSIYYLRCKSREHMNAVMPEKYKLEHPIPKPRIITREEAIEMGANGMGELLILLFVVAFAVFEYSKSAVKEKRKQQKLEKRFADLENKINKNNNEIKLISNMLNNKVNLTPNRKT